jgi:hypothetical protein
MNSDIGSPTPASKKAKLSIVHGGEEREVRRTERPPDPMRYVRLWGSRLGGGVGVGALHRTAPPALSEQHSSAIFGQVPPPPTPPHIFEAELKLASYNQRIWDRIDECQQIIVQCEDEINELRRQLDRATIVPKLFDRSQDADVLQKFWDDDVPLNVKHDATLAWTVVNTALRSPLAKGGYNADVSKKQGHVSAFPLPFQKMMWEVGDDDVGAPCPLRKDRDLMLASLEGGLDETIRIPWTNLLDTDREVLLKIFGTCPWCLDDADVPPWCLEDKEVFLTFVGSRALTYYRMHTLKWARAGVATQFSSKLLLEEDVLIQLLPKSDDWSKRLVAKTGIGDPSKRHPLLDDAGFILRAAERLKIPDYYAEYYSKCSCPVRYERLSSRLKASREIVLAFIPLDLDIVKWSKIPRGLESDPDILQGRIKADPDYAYLRRLVFPPDDSTDRNAAVRQVLVRSTSRWYACHWAAVERVQDRAFWTDVAVTHHCPVAGYDFIPEEIASARSVIVAWARHASCMNVRWLAWADDQANVLSDRETLLNCLPQVWKACNRGSDNVWGRIDPAILDEPMWIELLARTAAEDVKCIATLVLDDLNNDTFHLRALLRCSMKKVDMFNKWFRELPPGVQLQCADVLVEACRTCRDGRVYFWGLNPELFHVPEVVHAALSWRWCSSEQHAFDAAVATAPWSRDPSFLLSVAEQHSAADFWGCCSVAYRQDKGLMVKAIRLNWAVWSCLDDDLRYDFDVLCGALLRSDTILKGLPRLDAESRRDAERCGIPTRRIRSFAGELRRRLGLFASLETLMAGICASTLTTGFDALPLSLLHQGTDTLDAFKVRLTAWLGAPTDKDEVSEYRHVSNVLSRYGF